MRINGFIDALNSVVPLSSGVLYSFFFMYKSQFFAHCLCSFIFIMKKATFWWEKRSARQNVSIRWHWQKDRHLNARFHRNPWAVSGNTEDENIFNENQVQNSIISVTETYRKILHLSASNKSFHDKNNPMVIPRNSFFKNYIGNCNYPISFITKIILVHKVFQIILHNYEEW